MTEPRVWSVTQVNRAVRGLLEDTIESLWIGAPAEQQAVERPAALFK